MSLLSEFDHLSVVLVAARNPLNIGAAARAMSNFGFRNLRVVNPYHLAFREARSAVGASPILAAAEEFANLADAIADCSLVVGTTSVGPRELQHRLRSLPDAAPLIRKRMITSRVALLFGSERVGLSNEDLSHCDWLLRIPTRREHRSMNLAQSVVVCLYELARQPKISRATVKTIPANKAEQQRITTALVEALRLSGYIKPPSESDAETKARRLISRLEFSARDAAVCLGMLHQIIWKLRAVTDPAE